MTMTEKQLTKLINKNKRRRARLEKAVVAPVLPKPAKKKRVKPETPTVKMKRSRTLPLYPEAYVRHINWQKLMSFIPGERKRRFQDEPESAPITRPEAAYNQARSPYGIADELFRRVFS